MAKSNKIAPLAKIGNALRRRMFKSMGNFNYLKLIDRLTNSPEGQYWREQHKPYHTPLIPDEELLFNKAKELSLERLREQGHEPKPGEVDAALREISCVFNPELHENGTIAANVVMEHMFQQQVPGQPFASPDGREYKYIDLLRKYQEQGLGVVYLCNHSSHLDEFIVDVVLDNHHLGLPLFAAGSNMLALTNLNPIIRMGSYIVQRRATGRVYLACQYGYCQAISQTGHQQGIFLEAWHGGARSRDGSLRYPRRLITLRGAIDSGDRDVVIQPVALSYSIVPEDMLLADKDGMKGWIRGMGFWRTFLRFIMNPKKAFWRSSKGLYGRAYCTLTRPRLLSELKTLHENDKGELNLDEFVALTAMKDIAAAKKVMSSQLVARALVRARRNEHINLPAAMEQEREQMVEYHQAAFGTNPDFEDFIDNNRPEKVLAEGRKILRKRRVLKRGKDYRALPKVNSARTLSFYATHGDRRLYSPTARENVVVAGAGDLSYAWAYLIGNRTLEEKRYLNASFTLYDSRSEEAAEMGVERSSTGLYHEFRLPRNVFVTDDPTSAFKKANMVIMAAPMEELRGQLRTCIKEVELPTRLVLITNGFEPSSNKLSLQVALEELQTAHTPVSLYALVGPVIESDLLKGQPGRVVLAGPNNGLREVGHLFRWPPLQVVVGEDPLGLHLALILSEIYGTWWAFASLGKELQTPGMPGIYASEASQEAMVWARVFGADRETFNSTSPIWLSSLSTTFLSKPVKELASSMLKQQGKQKENRSLLYSGKQKGEEPEFKLKLKQSFISLKAIADQHSLDLPIFQQAYATFMGAEKPGK